jgi:hypothetical protein
MELYWLQDFLALVRTGSFSRAAAERHVTQSTFSRRIQALEDWVGAPLFDRGARPVELTSAGQQMLPIAVGSVEPLLDFRASIRAKEADAAPTVTFLMPTACSAGFFPALLARLNREIGPLIGRGAVKPIDEVADLYAAGEADLALSYRHPALARPAGFDSLDAIEIADEPMIPVCAPQRRGSSGYDLPLAPGAALVYLPYGRSSYIGRAVDDEVARRVADVQVQNLFEDPLIFILKELALQGMGVAWLPLSTIERNLADGSLAHIGGGDWDIAMTVELLRRKKPLPPAAEAVWALLARGTPPQRAPLQTARVVPHRPAPARG